MPLAEQIFIIIGYTRGGVSRSPTNRVFTGFFGDWHERIRTTFDFDICMMHIYNVTR